MERLVATEFSLSSKRYNWVVTNGAGAGVPSGPDWPKVDRFLRSYSARWTLSELLRLHYREGWYVALRGGGLLLGSSLCYPFAWFDWAIFGIAAAMLIDGMLVATAHAFVTDPPKHPLRFVVLNVVSYVTLVPWFAIFFAPWADEFSRPLGWRSAIKLSFTAITAITATAAISPEAPNSGWVSFLVGIEVVVALYYLLVIVVRAVERQ
jgi:hypothetical protein